MSQQEMFHQSEQEPSESERLYNQDHNQDPREQQRSSPHYDQPPLSAQPYDPTPPYTAERPYADGDQSYQPLDAATHFNEKLRPKPPQLPSRTIGTWIGLCLLALIITGSLGFILSGILKILASLIVFAVILGTIATIAAFVNRRAEPPFTKTFSIAEQARLVVNNDAGTIRVWRSERQQVTVRATRYSSAFARSTTLEPINYHQNEDMIFITAQKTSDFNIFNYTSVALDIFVPANSSVQITNKAGSIEATGFQGHINATTGAGTVRLSQVNLSQGSTITSKAGTIQVEQSTLQSDTSITTNAGTLDFTGCNLHNAHLRTDAGTINIVRGQIAGNNSIKTSMGTINFSGSVGQQGTTSIKTDMGTINVTLPAQTSCTIDAHTDMGSVHNAFGSNSIVGSEPGAHLELRSSMGSIHIGRA
jgi:hypothetical protein